MRSPPQNTTLMNAPQPATTRTNATTARPPHDHQHHHRTIREDATTMKTNVNPKRPFRTTLYWIKTNTHLDSPTWSRLASLTEFIEFTLSLLSLLKTEFTTELTRLGWVEMLTRMSKRVHSRV